MLPYVLEKWKHIDCYDIKPNLYAVSNFGRLMNVQKQYILKPHKNNNNDYLVIGLITNNNYHLKYRHLLVHRLVAWYFCPGRDEIRNTVNHIDGNKLNNFAYNLEWVSQAENNMKAKQTGLNNGYGYSHYYSHFSEGQIETVCKLLEDGNYTSYSDILRYIGMEPSKNNNELIGNIKRRRTYTSISKNYNF